MKKLESLTHTPIKNSFERKEEYSVLSKEILSSLIYFDLFKYPLTQKEIMSHLLTRNISELSVTHELERLVQSGIVFSDKEYFFLFNKKELVPLRKTGNKLATEYIQKAQKISKFISRFPYVRGILLSGSVAKGYADKNSDIDYFIVTAPNRLWLSRTLLIAYKKIFLFNSKKYFCLNYFVDENHLEMEDQNIFTATEIRYLLPTYNETIYNEMLKTNSWIQEYFPNFNESKRTILPENNGRVKKLMELFFNNFLGTILDDFFLWFTETYWKFKFRNDLTKSIASIRCKKYVSKFHPHSFHHKVLNSYEKNIQLVEEKYNLSLRG